MRSLPFSLYLLTVVLCLFRARDLPGLTLGSATVGPAEAAPIVFSAAGPNAVAIQGQVEAFRAALGTLNRFT